MPLDRRHKSRPIKDRSYAMYDVRRPEDDDPKPAPPAGARLAEFADRFAALDQQTRRIVIAVGALVALVLVIIIAHAATGPSLDERVSNAYGYTVTGCETTHIGALGSTQVGECNGGYPFVIDGDGNVYTN